MKLHPGGRNRDGRRIARAAVFMISDECPFMNATCLTVDGGFERPASSGLSFLPRGSVVTAVAKERSPRHFDEV